MFRILNIRKNIWTAEHHWSTPESKRASKREMSMMMKLMTLKGKSVNKFFKLLLCLCPR